MIRTLTNGLIALTLGACAGLGLAYATTPEPAKAPKPPKPLDIHISEIQAATEYADWCGGRVELAPGGPYAVDCDK